MKALPSRTLLAVALCLAASQVLAEITIGVDLPLTGPAAGLGIPCKKGLDFWPDSIAGEKIKLIVLDDMSDPGQASKNARRFISEDKVDLIIGSAVTPAAIAIAAIAAEGHTVQLAEAPLELAAGKDTWTFRLPQSTALMAAGIVEHMKQSGVKSFAFIGYSDAYGESWLKDITRIAGDAADRIEVQVHWETARVNCGRTPPRRSHGICRAAARALDPDAAEIILSLQSLPGIDIPSLSAALDRRCLVTHNVVT